MKDVRLYKQLQSQLNVMISDVDALKIDISNKQKERNHKIKSIENLKREMAKIDNNKAIKVSEHAIVRYFERVKGFDIEQVEKDILSEDVLKLIETLGGSGTYPNKDFCIVMKNNTVLTVK